MNMIVLSPFPCCDPSVHYVKVKAKKILTLLILQNGKCQKMSGLGTVLTESMLQSIIYEGSRTHKCCEVLCF